MNTSTKINQQQKNDQSKQSGYGRNADYILSILLNVYHVGMKETDSGYRIPKFRAWHVYDGNEAQGLKKATIEVNGNFTRDAWKAMADWHQDLLEGNADGGKSTRFQIVAKNAIMKPPRAYISNTENGPVAVPVERCVIQRPTKIKVAGTSEWTDIVIDDGSSDDDWEL